jgi:hypothetical protein
LEPDFLALQSDGLALIGNSSFFLADPEPGIDPAAVGGRVGFNIGSGILAVFFAR